MRSASRRAVLLTASLAIAILAGCAPTSTAARLGTSPKSPTTAVTDAPKVTSTTAAIQAPAFAASVSSVTAAALGASWHSGCPVDPAQLRSIQLGYWGFDGQSHTGNLVVNVDVVSTVVQVFAALYAARFPISEMVPQSVYGGDDDTAAAADDTSGFNCRLAVASGPPHWSMHAYGEAIDVNDVQNPYVDGSTTIPPAGASYLDRNDFRPGMAVPGGTLVRAFAAVGWQWGGNWTGAVDYQHFSINGH